MSWHGCTKQQLDAYCPEWIVAHKLPGRTYNELADYFATVCDLLEIRDLTIHENRRIHGARYMRKRKRIEMGKWRGQISELVVLHEIAHHISPEYANHNETFVDNFERLLGQFMPDWVVAEFRLCRAKVRSIRTAESKIEYFWAAVKEIPQKLS